MGLWCRCSSAFVVALLLLFVFVGVDLFGCCHSTLSHFARKNDSTVVLLLASVMLSANKMYDASVSWK